MPSFKPSATPVKTCLYVCGQAQEHNSIVLAAPTGFKLDNVSFASYGTPTGVCGAYVRGTCYSNTTVGLVSLLCKGSQRCSFIVSNAIFGDDCYLISKRLYVQMCYIPAFSSTLPTFLPSPFPSVSPTLVPTSKPSNQPSLSPTTTPSIVPTKTPTSSPTSPSVCPFVCAFAREGAIVDISAPDGFVLSNVTFASYGTPTGICGSYAKSTCNSAKSVPVVTALCVGVRSCTFIVSNNIFSDDCFLTKKYLDVQICYTPAPSSIPTSALTLLATVPLAVDSKDGNLQPPVPQPIAPIPTVSFPVPQPKSTSYHGHSRDLKLSDPQLAPVKPLTYPRTEKDNIQKTNNAFKMIQSKNSICSEIQESKSMRLTAPFGSTFGDVIFASYGTPVGSCETSYFKHHSCDSPKSFAVVTSLCKGKKTCLITANNAVFGDECPSWKKRLYIKILTLKDNV